MKPLCMLATLAWLMVVSAQTVADQKLALADRPLQKEHEAFDINQELSQLKRQLADVDRRVRETLISDTASFQALLAESTQLRTRKHELEEAWRQQSVDEGAQQGEPYALWDQEEVTLHQLVMEYGSHDYLYVIPIELSGIKLHLYSNIPIPRESWSDLLELTLYHHGLGLRQINPYAKQLYMLKQDLSSVHTIGYLPEHVEMTPAGQRICYLVVPPVEQIRSIVQFFERFSDNRNTFVHQLGHKIAIVAMKEDVKRLLEFYEKVWKMDAGKITKVIPISKLTVTEMEKILNSFFGEVSDKHRMPFGKSEGETIGIFPITSSNSLVLMGARTSVERAEKMIKETEEQLEDPTETTVSLYTCRHSDPNDLAKVLEKAYLSLIYASHESAPKQTEVSFTAQSQGSKPPADGYPPMPPLVVSPPPLKPGVQSKLEIEQGPTEHFIPDPKTGTMLMTVQRNTLGKIRELLKKLDVPKKMVQMEVLMFERRLHSQDNYGLNLLKLGKTHNGVTYLPSVGPYPQKGAVPGVLQFFFHGASHKYMPQFDIAYNLLLTQEDLQLNAAPTVSTVNQTPATISIVEEISINNGAAPIDTNKGTSFEKSFARANYGIIIVLTPTIHEPEEAGGAMSATLKTNITFDTTKPHPDDRPMVDRRHVENEVWLFDGETFCIGGLRRKSRIDREEKVPLFGDIPLLGKLFGTTQLTDNDTEMFFFITLKIITDARDEAAQLQIEEWKHRPGDIPEFLQAVEQSYAQQKRQFFHKSLRRWLVNDR